MILRSCTRASGGLAAATREADNGRSMSGRELHVQRRLSIGAAVAVLSLAFPPAAVGVPGQLTAAGCIQDVGKADCGVNQQGLEGVGGVVVSPDGRSVYALGYIDAAIVRFDRAPTGALTPAGCIQDAGLADCGPTQQGLDQVSAATVSPDGRSVYAVSENPDHAIVSFNRDPATGALSGGSCIQDVGLTDCPTTQEGLEYASDVAVSPDGKSVYVAGEADRAIVRFNRDPATGALSGGSCIQDPSLTDCPVAQEGLHGANGVAVSADGASVYVASTTDGAIVRFNRDPGTGALSGGACIQDVGLTDCPTTQQGLEYASDVAVSPDGTSVYVAGEIDSAVVRFNRDPATGALTPAGCIQDVGMTDCGPTQQGLGGAVGVAASPDDRSVYVTGDTDDTLVRFDRDPATGALGGGSCIQDVGKADCGSNQEGLDEAGGVGVSADERSVYVGSFGDDAIVRFDREPTLPETKIGKHPKRKTEKRKARFTFSSDDPGATFECKIDKKQFRPCDSSKREKLKVKVGKHRFRVRAVDPGGNADATPAKRKWRVLKA